MNEPDAFIRIETAGDLVLITAGGNQFEATPEAAREIARNLIRKADEIQERSRSKSRRGHLTRVK
jgi:hypothetical protein